MNKYILCSLLTFFSMILSIILSLQIQLGIMSIIAAIVVLGIGMISLGYLLKVIFEEYKKISVEKRIMSEKYLKCLESIKIENNNLIKNLEISISLKLKENIETVNKSLIDLNKKMDDFNIETNNLNKTLLEIKKIVATFEFDKLIDEIKNINEIVELLNIKIDKSNSNVKNIIRCLEEENDNIDEIKEISNLLNDNMNNNILGLKFEIKEVSSKLKNINREINTIEEGIENLDFAKIVEASKNHIDKLNNILQKSNKENKMFIETSLKEYKNICDTFLKQSRDLTKEDNVLLNKILGELR